MQVGSLEIFRPDGERDLSAFKGKGHLQSLKVERIDFRLVGRAYDPQMSQRAPTHDIVAVGAADGLVIGAAWVREVQRGDMAGAYMVSLSFQDPDLPEWTGNVAAFPSKDGGAHRIVAERRRGQGKAGAQPAANGAAQPAAAASSDDDDIPF